MKSLAERARLRRFEDVIGQTDVVAYLRGQTETAICDPPARDNRGKEGRSVILCGPPGSGKATLGDLYAKALLCQHVNPPCGDANCGDCSAFEQNQHPNFREVLGSAPAAEVVDAVEDAYRFDAFGGGWKVTFIRDADLLSEDCFFALHHRLKRVPSKTAFILSTARFHKLPPRTTALFQCWQLHEPTVEERLRALRRAVDLEKEKLSEHQLTMIAELAESGFTAAFRDLECLADVGLKDDKSILAFYGLDRAAPAFRYVASVLDRLDTTEQVKALDAWGASPEVKLRAIEDVLGTLFHWTIKSPKGMEWISEADQARLSKEVYRRAQDLKCSPRELYEAMIELWKLDSAPSRAQLTRKASTFDRVLNGEGLQPLIVQTRETFASRKASDEIAGRNAKSYMPPHHAAPNPRTGSAYLTRDQVADLWMAASFMVQEYGVLLNSVITVHCSRLGLADSQAVSRFITRLTQEIRQRLDRQAKGGGPLYHWLFVLERGPNGLLARIAAHVPRDDRGLDKWLQESFLARRLPTPGAGNALTFKHYDYGNEGRAVRRHFLLLRLLSRGVDPSIAEDVYAGDLYIRKERLVDLIAIPRIWRRAVGYIPDVHRCGKSRHLATKARQSASEVCPIIDPFARERWAHVADGWELEEFKFREDWQRRQDRDIGVAERTWSGDSQLERIRREAEIRALRSASKGRL